MKTALSNIETKNKFNSFVCFIKYHWNDGNWTKEAENAMLITCLVFGILSLIIGGIFRY